MESELATNFDKNGTYNLGRQLATSVQAERDSGTPAGTFPAITFDVTGALGSFNITSRAGAHTTVNLNVSLMNAVDLFVDGAGSTLTLKAAAASSSARVALACLTTQRSPTAPGAAQWC